jgi:ABC-type bacteriocin/lantibiotic exporter with double-glycine peptidase domain
LLALFLGCVLKAHAQETAGVWLDVPFVKQSEEGCGSASLSMLLQYWSAHGASVDPARADAAVIQQKLYSRKAHGIFASDMQRYLTESGFRVFAVEGEWSDLRKHLSQGRPLIVSLQPGSKKSPLHYVVITGLDWEHSAIFLNDAARGKLIRVERAEFEKQWQAAGNWMLLAVPESAG